MAITVINDWAFVDDDDPQNRSTVTPGAGDNRVLVLAYGAGNHDISAFGWTVTANRWDEDNSSVSPVATYKWGDSTDDTPRYFAIWDESQIAAATGGKFWWAASTITNEFFGYAVYGNVKQTGLDSLVNDGSNFGTDQSSVTLTTTSNAGDRIIVVGALNTGNRSITNSDTLTEKHDVAAATNNARYYLGEGAGGDSSTVITNSTSCRPNHSSIVLVEAQTVAPKAMYHYRNHGKI